MKICLFTSDFPPMGGGITEFARSLVDILSLDDSIEHLQVVAFGNPVPGTDIVHRKLSVVRVGRCSRGRLILLFAKYAWKMRNYDIFHAMSVFPVGFLTILAGRILHKPSFVTMLGTEVLLKEGSWKTKYLKKYTVRNADRVLAISNALAKKVHNYVGAQPGKIKVVSYMLQERKEALEGKTVARRTIRAHHGLQEDEIVVLTVAHLIKRKGTADLLNAIAFAKNPRLRLIIIGKGPERQNLENLAAHLGIRGSVIFTDKIDREEVFDYYHASDIFVLPSYYLKEEGDIEGLGIVLVEAAQCGLPVIGTNSGGIPETMYDGRSGYIVPERDVRALAEKLGLLADDKALRERLGAYGRAFVSKKFNPKDTIMAYVHLYKTALRSKT